MSFSCPFFFGYAELTSAAQSLAVVAARSSPGTARRPDQLAPIRGPRTRLSPPSASAQPPTATSVAAKDERAAASRGPLAEPSDARYRQLLVLPLVLIRLRAIGDVRGAGRRRRLRRHARVVAGDVPAGSRAGRVRVDRVLVAERGASGPLVGRRQLDTQLGTAGPAGTGGEAVMAVLAAAVPCRRCPASGPGPGRSWPCC